MAAKKTEMRKGAGDAAAVSPVGGAGANLSTGVTPTELELRLSTGSPPVPSETARTT